MNDEGQDSKTVHSFAQIVFCSKYLSLALLKLLSCSRCIVSSSNKLSWPDVLLQGDFISATKFDLIALV